MAQHNGTILWHSNHTGYPTGYGNQTAIFTPMIKKAGYDTVISAFTLEGSPRINSDGIVELPKYVDAYGNDILGGHYLWSRADLLFTLIDPFALNPNEMQRFKWAAWCPIDSYPDKPGNTYVLRRADWHIAMSRYGEGVLKEAGFEKVFYVPHGIDTSKFKPANRKEARQRLSDMLHTDLSKKFLVIDVMANKANRGGMHRKNPDGIMETFGQFVKYHPEAVLYLHTDPDCQYGHDLHRIAESYGIKDKVLYPASYNYAVGMFGTDYLRDVYSAADVMLHLSLGEGFGIPIVEAQACGCPVIVGDATATSELCFSGHKIPTVPTNPGIEGVKMFMPVPGKALEALAFYHANRHNVALRDKAVEGAKEYEATKVFNEHFLPTLKAIFKDIDAEKEALVWRVIPPRKEPPQVSVVMPVYNGIETVDKAITSVLSQDVDLELVIVDDCSDDGTWKHLRKWRKDPRVRIEKMETGGGVVGALNRACELAKGKYIIKLDSDDWFEQGALKPLAQCLDDNPHVGFVYGQCQYHGTQTQLYIPQTFNPEDFLIKNHAVGEMMYRREAHRTLKHRGFWEKEGRWYGPHDWDFCLQMIYDLNWEGYALKDVLVHHYMHHENGMHNETKARNGAVIAAFKEQWQGLKASAI